MIGGLPERAQHPHRPQHVLTDLRYGLYDDVVLAVDVEARRVLHEARLQEAPADGLGDVDALTRHVVHVVGRVAVDEAATDGLQERDLHLTPLVDDGVDGVSFLLDLRLLVVVLVVHLQHTARKTPHNTPHVTHY